MEQIKKNALTDVYYQSRNVMLVIYIILIVAITSLSSSKVPVCIFAVSIPLLLILSEIIQKTETWNPYYVTLPLCMVLTSIYELNTTIDEPFWLFFIVIIYHTILFIDNPILKLVFIGVSIIQIFGVEYALDYSSGIILSRLTAALIFSITTYLGFSFLLDKQLEVSAALATKNEAEKKLKAYAADLEKKNSELDQFAYVVSHDLKAPLRGINNLSSWIEEDLGPNITSDSHKNFVLLRSRVLRMENLINGILAYSRAGRAQNEDVYFSTYELIQEICSTLTTDKNVVVNIVQPLPFLKTEKIKVEQVLTNLISNAIKHNKNLNPEITITAVEKVHECVFCIADNGQGIDPSYHQKIFKIFQTLQSRDSQENTGVGLAIVKKIVEENGGKIWVESEIGMGAKFFFTWPK